MTAISPVLLNCCVIISGLIPHWGASPVYYFSVAVSLSGVLQLALTMVVAARKNIGMKITLLRDSDMKEFLKRAMMSTLSGCITQVNLWLNTLFASFIPGAISYMYYADRLNQLPQALVGISMSTVLLPAISKLAVEGSTQRMIEMQNNALDLGMTLMVPAAAALIAIPDALLLALLNYGRFDYLAIGNTVPVVAVLATSLPSFVAIKILLLFFYARGEFKIPAFFSCISVTVNALLSYVLMQFLGHVGIAIASSAGSWTYAALLLVYLKIHKYSMSEELSRKLTYIFLSSAIMVIVICMAKTLLTPFFFQGAIVKISSLIVVVLLGVLVYFFSLLVMFRQKLAVE